MVAAEARLFERIRYAAAGFFGQVLQIGVDIIMSNQHCLLFLQQLANTVLEPPSFLGRRRSRYSCPCFGGATGAVLHLRALEFDDLDGLSWHDHSRYQG